MIISVDPFPNPKCRHPRHPLRGQNYNMLSRFVNIRNAGKAPNEKDPTESAKAPAPTSLNATPGAAGATAG